MITSNYEIEFIEIKGENLNEVRTNFQNEFDNIYLKNIESFPDLTILAVQQAIGKILIQAAV